MKEPPAVLLGRLYALRELLDGVIDAFEQEATPPAAPVCEHPEESRKYRDGTMGSNVGFTCTQCGAVVTAVETPEQIRSRIVRPGSPPGAET